MLTFEQMFVRLAIALALGALIGLERNLARKEAGIRTSMLVAGGSAIFTMIGLMLPYLSAATPDAVPAVIAGSTFMNVIANIIVGIGFLGAGIIIKTQEHVHGLTTAAVVWTTASIGVLVGLNLVQFAVVATIVIAGLLYILRKLDIAEIFEKQEKN